MREKLSYANVMATIAVVGVVAGGAGAIAATSGPTVIRTCYAKKGGALRVTSKRCNRKRERALQFNQQGVKGATGAPGAPGTSGTPGRSALAPLQSGETIRGVWSVAGPPGGTLASTGITLPIPAPQAIDSSHANFAANDSITGDGCTGTAAAPVSAPGFVCIYTSRAQNTTSANGRSSDELDPSPGSPWGFIIEVIGASGAFQATGTWIYTAP
jgi:hypothetical protein